MQQTFDEQMVASLRGLAMDLPALAQSGHSGTAMALSPLGWLLYSRVLRHDPKWPQWPDRDRLVLSSGHAVVLLYGLLHACGYDLTVEDLGRFREMGSRTPGHPETWMTEGIDFSTGPLGQGLAAAVGMAYSERQLQQEFGPELVDHRTYCICSDGDLMEGVTSEACSLAGTLGLGKLIVFYDDNQVTIDGPTSRTFTENVALRFESYGWQVQWIANGDNLDEIGQAIQSAQADERPSLIGIRTIIGFPAPTLSGRSEAHSPAFPADEIAQTKHILGLNPDKQMQFPPLEAFRAAQINQGAQLSAGWKQRLEDSPHRHGWNARLQRRWPAEYEPVNFKSPVATRVASGLVLQNLARVAPQLLVGSADLAGSTQVQLPQPDRNLNFGVRELAMAAICNGIVAHGGLVPICSTYFAFSDQMKPALRLAALAGLPTISVWTHDSLALGEDGPTHQPVEQLATLRAMPNFWVFRPADAQECQQAWKLAWEANCPVGLVLSRQNLPLLGCHPQVELGAYVVAEGPVGSPTLLASGSEVHLCLQARQALAPQLEVRVVSFPCWELFEQQTPHYQAQVLGSGPRLAVEAASWLGWHRWTGSDGDVLALDRFGISGPGPDVMQHLGFSVENIVARLRKICPQLNA